MPSFFFCHSPDDAILVVPSIHKYSSISFSLFFLDPARCESPSFIHRRFPILSLFYQVSTAHVVLATLDPCDHEFERPLSSF